MRYEACKRQKHFQGSVTSHIQFFFVSRLLLLIDYELNLTCILHWTYRFGAGVDRFGLDLEDAEEFYCFNQKINTP